MKTFIIKSLTCIVAVYLLYALLGLFMPFYIFDRSYPIYVSQLNFADKVNDSTKILIIGDSRVVSAINTSSKLPKSRNLGLVGSTPIDGYYILERFLKNNKTSVVFISYGWDRLGMKYYPEIITERGIPLGLYGIAEYIDLKQNARRIDSAFFENLKWETFINNRFYTPVFMGNKLKNFSKKNKLINDSIYNSVNRQNGHITSIWGRNKTCNNCSAFESSIDSFYIKPIYDYYLKKIFSLCKENNIKAIFETIPFNQTTYENIPELVHKEYRAYLSKLQYQNTNAIINDTLFYYPDNFFEDGHHIKPLGALIYTEYITKKYFNKKLANARMHDNLYKNLGEEEIK